jgi:hypothetical protein
MNLAKALDRVSQRLDVDVEELLADSVPLSQQGLGIGAVPDDVLGHIGASGQQRRRQVASPKGRLQGSHFAETWQPATAARPETVARSA